MRTDIKLTLGGNRIETSATGLTVDIYNGETIAQSLADAFEGSEQTGLNAYFDAACLFAKALFFSTGFGDNLVELGLLYLKVIGTLLDDAAAFGKVRLAGLNLTVDVANLLVQQFYFERLVFDFLLQRIVFTVIAHLVKLLTILLHQGTGLADAVLLLHNDGLKVGNLLFEFRKTMMKALDFVLKVLNFCRKFSAESTDFVNLRKFCLKLVKVLQFLLHTHLCGQNFFCTACHIIYNKRGLYNLGGGIRPVNRGP